MIRQINSNQDGYVLLTSMMIIMAIGAAVTTGVLLLAIDAGRTSQITQQGESSTVLASTCAEEALEQIRRDNAFTGTNTVNIQDNSCSYTVTSGGGELRTIQASGSTNNTIAKVQIQVDAITPEINVTSWQEVGDF